MALNIRTVIAELQFINELSQSNPGDKRIPQLLAQAQEDLAAVSRSTLAADDPLGGSGN